MKKELLGYLVVFMKEEMPLSLSIDEGVKLVKALNEGATFITISRLALTIRSNTIDRVIGQYKKLEEKCLFCLGLKPVNSECPRGCDNRNENNLQILKKMKKDFGKEMPGQ